MCALEVRVRNQSQVNGSRQKSDYIIGIKNHGYAGD